MVSEWLEEDCPSFDYAGFVVGEQMAEAYLMGKSPVGQAPGSTICLASCLRCLCAVMNDADGHGEMSCAINAIVALRIPISGLTL